MSNINDSKPLDPDEVVPEEFEDEDLYGGTEADGLSHADKDEDKRGLPAKDRENQAGTEQMDPDKFRRD